MLGRRIETPPTPMQDIFGCISLPTQAAELKYQGHEWRHGFDIKSPRMWFGSASKEAYIEHCRWHDHRQTFCSRLVMRGHNLKVIQELAGHKTTQMSARYACLGQKTLRSAVDAYVDESVAVRIGRYWSRTFSGVRYDSRITK